jgi:ABC-type lipoprotein release transport system permease subunit
VEVGDSVRVVFEDGSKHIYKVVGLIEVGNSGFDNNGAFTNIADLEKILDVTGKSTGIMLKLFDKRMSNEVKAELQAMGIRETVQTWDDMLGFVKDLLNVFSSILFVITGIASVAASFGIAVLMYINVLRKTKQIGTLKAIGASKEFIMSLFLLEALIIAILGIASGWICSIGIINYLTANPIYAGTFKIQFVADVGMLINSSLLTLFFVVVAALYPAYVASKLQVVEAMRRD